MKDKNNPGEGRQWNYNTPDGAEELRMTCEHKNCQSHDGRDYKRKKVPIWLKILALIFRIKYNSWGNEPIFLCDEHSKGYKSI